MLQLRVMLKFLLGSSCICVIQVVWVGTALEQVLPTSRKFPSQSTNAYVKFPLLLLLWN